MAATLRLVPLLGGLVIALTVPACGHDASKASQPWERWAEQENLDAQAIDGARIYLQAGCSACHIYLEKGTVNLGAPDLSEEGKRDRGNRWQIAHLKCPSCLQPGSTMPAFANFTEQQYRALAAFLEQSRAVEG
jgi:cbb3-type cytochrome oxidase cytochrome c subunit